EGASFDPPPAVTHLLEREVGRGALVEPPSEVELPSGPPAMDLSRRRLGIALRVEESLVEVAVVDALKPGKHLTMPVQGVAGPELRREGRGRVWRLTRGKAHSTPRCDEREEQPSPDALHGELSLRLGSGARPCASALGPREDSVPGDGIEPPTRGFSI